MSTIELDPLPREGTQGAVLIKSERWTRITIEGDLVRKVYVTRPRVAWRTFMRPSRARREYDNLIEMRKRGIPTVEPVGFRDSRRRGLSHESEISTRLVKNACNFRDVIRGRPEDPGGGQLLRFRAAARLVGASLRRMHACGIMFATASPRNWIIDLDRFPSPASCLACDPPYAVFSHRDLTGTLRASVDLYTLVFSHGRRTTLSAADRMRILLGYARGDRSLARRVWRRLSGRYGWLQTLLRASLVVTGGGSRVFMGRPRRNMPPSNPEGH